MPQLNILLITSDQQHYDTLGVTNPCIRTPNLDRLAAEGTRSTGLIASTQPAHPRARR